MNPQPDLDPTKLAAFADRALHDLGGAYISLACAIGDRLGLFKTLATQGPATSAELATRAGVDERYAREWLSLLACAEYLSYDPLSQRFTLPPEGAALLTQDTGPQLRLAAFFAQVPGMAKPFDRLLRAFRRGGGVSRAAYDDDFYRGDERLTAAVYESCLVQHWIPALPDVRRMLERGALVGDIGCGGGRALVTLAQAYGDSRYVGYDVFEPNVARATSAASSAGVADRVRFVQRDVSGGLEEAHDLLLAVMSLHDSAAPLKTLTAIRRALRPDGTFLCVEGAYAERLEENTGLGGVMRYGSSLLYCVPTALTGGGAGLGSVGLPEPKLRALCAAAGFRSVRRVPVPPAVWAVYEVRP